MIWTSPSKLSLIDMLNEIQNLIVLDQTVPVMGNICEYFDNLQLVYW